MAVRDGGATQSAEDIERVLTRQESQFIRVFRRAVAGIISANTLDDLEALLLAGRVEDALTGLTAAANALGAQYGTSYTAAAQAAAAFLSADALTVTIGFDQSNQRAVDQMRQNRLRIVREFTAEQRRATQEALIDGIARGVNPRQQAQAFRQSIGLTQTQMRAVNNYRRALTDGRAGGLPTQTALDRQLRDARSDRSVLRAIRDNRPLPPEQVDSMVARYQQNYLRYRSETIARTEALRSVNQGTEELYQQAIDDGELPREAIERTWNTAQDERVRSSHASIGGQTKPPGEPWQTNGATLRYPGDPAAPAAETINCRCVISTRIVG